MAPALSRQPRLIELLYILGGHFLRIFESGACAAVDDYGDCSSLGERQSFATERWRMMEKYFSYDERTQRTFYDFHNPYYAVH